MAFGNLNLAIAINRSDRPVGGSACRHHHHSSHKTEGPEKPDRNPFLDFLTAPLQAMGKMDGNQNDKEYSKFQHAHEAGNLLKGF